MNVSAASGNCKTMKRTILCLSGSECGKISSRNNSVHSGAEYEGTAKVQLE